MTERFPDCCRSLYLDLGFSLIEPGTPQGVKLGLRSKDWHSDTFLARQGDLVILPLLRAHTPGRGSFPKLLAHLDARRLQVAIFMPTGRFRDYLERTGWRMAGGDLWVR